MPIHDGDAPRRSPEERRADHGEIDRLADDLLPALVAKLGASGLGELQVREDAWSVRLRMPGDARAVRRAGAAGRPAGRAELHASAGSHVGGVAVGPGTAATPATGETADPEPAPTRAIATSPAVGFFRPRGDLVAGARVRAGDRVGTIDVLGVPYEVVAPTDGIVGATLVGPGDPVEYGQDVVEVELLAPPAAARPEPG